MIPLQLSQGVSRIHMRRFLFIVPLVGLIACGADTITHSLAPPTPGITGSVRTVTDSTGALGVEVAAHVTNGTAQHFHLCADPPLYVKVIPDWSPTEPLNLGIPDRCSPEALTVDLRPGDSTVIARVIPGNAFPSTPPTIYGFAVGVVFDGGSVTLFAGSTRVPLVSGNERG